MDFYQIENKYIEKIINTHSVLLLPVEDAINLMKSIFK